MSDNSSSLTALRHGCANSVQFLTHRVCGISRCVYLECECRDICLSSFVDGVRFRFGSHRDLNDLTAAEHEYGAAERLFSARRLDRGDSLMLGECAGEVVFYSWMMCGQMEVDVGTTVPIVPGTAYIYKMFTVPRFRGRHISSAFYAHIRPLLESGGCNRLVCRIAPSNTPSIRAHQRTGFQPKGQLWKFVIADRPVYHADPQMRAWLPSICPPGYFNSGGFLVRRELDRVSPG